jgi:hypothetical protein
MRSFTFVSVSVYHLYPESHLPLLGKGPINTFPLQRIQTLNTSFSLWSVSYQGKVGNEFFFPEYILRNEFANMSISNPRIGE